MHPSPRTPSSPARDSSATRTAPSLTEVEGSILDFLVSYLRRNTYQPSIREIGSEFGIKSTKTVSEHLQALADKGFIERDPSRSRGIRILGLDLNAQTVSLPCFRDLGEATAGSVAGAAALRVTLDAQLVGRGGGFLVRAPGDRLGSVGIGERDFLVVQPVRAEMLRHGDIVVARRRGEADYFQLRAAGSRLSIHSIGKGSAGLGEGSAAVEEDSAVSAEDAPRTVIVGRVAALYRRLGAQPAPTPVTAH